MATPTAIAIRRIHALSSIAATTGRLAELFGIEAPEDVPGGVKDGLMREAVRLEILQSFLDRAEMAVRRARQQEQDKAAAQAAPPRKDGKPNGAKHG
jgi:hypothetical protein